MLIAGAVASSLFFYFSPQEYQEKTATFLNFGAPEEPTSALFHVEKIEDVYGLYLNLLGDKPTMSMRSVKVTSDCTILPLEYCPPAEEEVVFTTEWSRVRFDPTSMTIDTQDFTFAETEVTVTSSDPMVSQRLALYKQQHVAFGVAYGAGALAYADFANQIVEFNPSSDHAVRPSRPFDDSNPSINVWYNYQHKEAKVFNPEENTLGSLSTGRFLPVKYTNSDRHDILSFDPETGKAGLNLSVRLDNAEGIPKAARRSLPFDIDM